MSTRPALLLATTLPWVACGPPCDSDMATISGFAAGNGDISIRLYDAGSLELVASTSPDEDGQYTLTVEGGRDYVLNATATQGQDTGGGVTTCYSEDIPISPAPCAALTQDIAVPLTCDTADKPNLYLYPERDTPTVVHLAHDPRQEVFASAPPYAGTWKGTAHPDGTFTPFGGERAPYLFYEITLLPGQVADLQRSERFCLPGDRAVEAMAELLGAYGFSARERADFVEGWRDDLPRAERYAVYPQLRVDDAVRVQIQPPLPLHRLWFVVEDGEGCVPNARPPQAVPRAGPHAVEWGVVLRGLR
jgi:hypothetical protein